MAKKRSHERTSEERAMHEMAVKLRKMTDDQLIEAFNDRYSEGYIDGGGIKSPSASFSDIGEELLNGLRGAKGIGAATFAKIEAIVREMMGGST